MNRTPSLLAKQIRLYDQKKRILENISLSITPSRIITILGLNGAGKTTLLRCLAGLLTPDSGEVELHGRPLLSYSAKQRGQAISYSGQGYLADTACSVREFVVMGVTPYLGLFEVPSSAQMEQAEEALNHLGIGHLAGKPFLETSTGERQLAFLARGLLQGTRFLLMDEPTAFLDFRRQHEFFQDLRDFVCKNDKAAVITLHDPNLALAYSDEVLFLHQGEVLAHLLRKETDFLARFEQCAKQIYSERLTLTSTKHGTVVVWE